MSKYIIEIKPEYEDSFKGVMILGAKDNNLFVDTLAVENLEQYTPVDVEKIYGKACADGYKRGLEDGKAVHDKGCEGCKYANVAGTHEPCVRCSNSYPNQWTAKDDKIEVGDEVKHKSDRIAWTAIVTRICCGTLTLMEHNGASADNYPIEDFVKTGRHFDIASILEDMRT